LRKWLLQVQPLVHQANLARPRMIREQGPVDEVIKQYRKSVSENQPR